MRYRLGRLLQLIGMVLLPLAIAGNLADPERVSVRDSLMLSGAGVLVFCVGWLLQQGARPG